MVSRSQKKRISKAKLETEIKNTYFELPDYPAAFAKYQDLFEYWRKNITFYNDKGNGLNNNTNLRKSSQPNELRKWFANTVATRIISLMAASNNWPIRVVKAAFTSKYDKPIFLDSFSNTQYDILLWKKANSALNDIQMITIFLPGGSIDISGWESVISESSTVVDTSINDDNDNNNDKTDNNDENIDNNDKTDTNLDITNINSDEVNNNEDKVDKDFNKTDNNSNKNEKNLDKNDNDSDKMDIDDSSDDSELLCQMNPYKLSYNAYEILLRTVFECTNYNCNYAMVYDLYTCIYIKFPDGIENWKKKISISATFNEGENKYIKESFDNFKDFFAFYLFTNEAFTPCFSNNA